MSETPLKFIGQMETTIFTIYGKQVPDISARENADEGTITFILDTNSHAIDVPKNFATAFILFVADAMAQGAGFSSFGSDNKFNKFNRNITCINSSNMDDLIE